MQKLVRDIGYFIQISRPINVFIAVLAFGVACYIAASYTYQFLFEDPRFYATALTVAIITATGYWINDVYDFRIDRINKPKKSVVNAILSVKKVLTFYFIVNGLILLFSAYYLGFVHKQYDITVLNGICILLLFVYSSYLKRISVIGNLLIAFLVSLVIILAGYLYFPNTELVYTVIFAFEITLIREITKDIEDIHGDLQFNLQTLPIQIGIKGTKRVLFVLYILFLVSCYIPFFVEYTKDGSMLWKYLVASIVLVQLPVLYIILLLSKAYRPSDFTTQSRYLKYLIFAGLISVLFLN